MRVWLIVLLFFYTGILSADHTVDTAIYDPNGNMKTDQYRSTVLNYDRANLPCQIVKYNNPSSTTYHFGYGVADNRIFKGTMSQAYYYLGSQGIYDINADKWEHYPGGVLRLKNGDIQKIVKDHLSNTRAIVGDNSSCIGLITAYDYYPFGKVLRKHENPISRYQSTDHEKDSETGYDDRNARMYDDEAFNFLQTDQFANDYSSWSPYHYAGRNPIIFFDPTGNSWFKHDETGAIVWNESREASMLKGNQCYDNVGESYSWTKELAGGKKIMQTGGANGEVTTLFPNEKGLVRFPENGNGFARYTNNSNDRYPLNGVEGQHGDNWISPKAGSALYNTFQDFNQRNPNIIVHYGDISAYDPKINLGHKTHNQGNAIDIHYMGKNGQELSGKRAYLNADKALTNTFFELAQKHGFTKNYSYGNRFTHLGNNNQGVHKDHLHIAIPNRRR